VTHWSEKYLACEYLDGERGPNKFDCWGLVRHVLHYELGGRLMPSWGHVRNTMPRLFTRAYQAEASAMVECEPCEGAIASVFRGALMIHVGIVFNLDGRLHVLEINENTGARIKLIKDFAAPFYKVRYYCD
jgi:hypothetical protein